MSASTSAAFATAPTADALRGRRLGRLLLAAALAPVLSVALSGCGNVRATLGLDKKPPDEFSVVTRAPLTLPPDAKLRPPRTGERDTGENSPVERAKQAVFGMNAEPTANPSNSQGEQSLLRRAGATDVRPNIRQVIDEEGAQAVKADERLIDEILFWRKAKETPASIVNASKEAERLRTNSALGLPPTEGETPSVDSGKRKGGLLEGLF